MSDSEQKQTCLKLDPPSKKNPQEMKFDATQSYYTTEGITKLGGRLDEGEDKDLCNE